MRSRCTWLFAVGLQAGIAITPARAADPIPGTPDASDISIDIDVISRRLDVARQQIQPSLGASTYGYSPDALAAIPQGADAPLNQVLLRAPGVATDSFGQLHVRGEHANAVCTAESTRESVRLVELENRAIAQQKWIEVKGA